MRIGQNSGVGHHNITLYLCLRLVCARDKDEISRRHNAFFFWPAGTGGAGAGHFMLAGSLLILNLAVAIPNLFTAGTLQGVSAYGWDICDLMKKKYLVY